MVARLLCSKNKTGLFKLLNISFGKLDISMATI